MVSFFRKYIASLYLGKRLYGSLAVCILLFIWAFFFPLTRLVPLTGLLLLVSLVIVDYILLFGMEKGLSCVREVPERLSNGDDNDIRLYLDNRYMFPAHLEVIDEVPVQFQKRNILWRISIAARSSTLLTYQVCPTRRGEYSFGHVNVYGLSPLSFLKRRYRLETPKTTAVFPSFLRLRKYILMATSNRLDELGVKRERRRGHSLEFEQIKEYVHGDDYRTLNWKATARKGQLMVNQFMDERAQQVYMVIDKGRLMKMPFNGLTLLDHAINASLVLSHIVLVKMDKAGLITFSDKRGAFLPADRRPSQMTKILELLYQQKTRFLESDYEKLYARIRSQLHQRSLLMLFTNFETLQGMQRQLPYLRGLSQHHLLLVVIFENSAIQERSHQPATTAEEVYIKTIAGKFAFEKRQIALELERYGIQTILTAPEHLTVNTISKYLAIKARQQA